MFLIQCIIFELEDTKLPYTRLQWHMSESSAYASIFTSPSKSFPSSYQENHNVGASSPPSILSLESVPEKHPFYLSPMYR